MPPMDRRLVPVLAAIALVASAPARAPAAEEPITWYTVEMIVFERTGNAGLDAELWPADPGLPDLADAIELSTEGMTQEQLAGRTSSAEKEAAGTSGEAKPAPLAPMPRAFRLLPPEEYRLSGVWKKLERSSAYRPLLQVAWVQPGYPAQDAPLVHIRNANAALGAVGASDERTSSPSSGNDTGFAATLSPRITVARDPSKPAIDGTVRVHRARYLHVEADLLYYRPLQGDAASAANTAAEKAGSAPPADSPDSAFIEQLLAEDHAEPRLFRLTEQRRMRSKELHYLDHPVFGVLVEAWPLELPEMPAEPLPAEGEGDSAPQPAQTGTGAGGG